MNPMNANYDNLLSLEVAIVLISEKVRFWSDEQIGLFGEAIPPRCMHTNRLTELRQALIEIDRHCKSALRLRTASLHTHGERMRHHADHTMTECAGEANDR